MSSQYAYSNPLYDYCPFSGLDLDDPESTTTTSSSKPTPKPRTSLRKRSIPDKEENNENETKNFDEETNRMAALLDEIETIANSFTAKLSHEKNVIDVQQQQKQQTLTERLEAVLEQDEVIEPGKENNRSLTSTPSPPPRRQPFARKRVPVSSLLLKMQFSSVSTVNEEDIEEDKSYTSFTSSSSSSSSPQTLLTDNLIKEHCSEKVVTPPPKLPPKRTQMPSKYSLPPIPAVPKPVEPEVEVEKLIPTTKTLAAPKATPNRSLSAVAFNIRFELLSLEHLHGNNHKVQRAGYLWKTGPNYKAFKNRWCVLSRHALDVGGQFVYYFNQQSMATSLTGKIMLSDVEFIGTIDSISNKTRPPKLSANERGTAQSSLIKNEFNFFKLGIRPRQGRVYLFAARSHSELQLWLHSFLQALSLHSVKNKEIYQCGFLRTRFTITGRWQLGLALLTTDRCLYLFEMTPGGELARVVDCKSYQIFNLRKTVRLASFDLNGFSLTQNGGRVVYLASEFETHINLWKEAVERFWRTPEVLEKSILAEQYLTKENVPVAIDKCLKFLDTFNRTGGKLFTEDGEKELKDFLQACNSNNNSSLLPFEQLGNVLAEIRSNAWEVHLLPQRLSAQHVAFLLFHYLKSMNECILTDLTLPEWLQVAEEEFDLETKRTKLKRLLQMLPIVNFASLRRIIIYLANQSISGPLSISVCKSLVFTKHIAMVRIPLSSARALLLSLIHDYLELFDVTSEEIEKELQIKRVAQLIITQNKESTSKNVVASSLVTKTSILTHGANLVAPAGHCSVTSSGNILVSRKVSVLIIGIRLYQHLGGVSTMNVHLNKETTAANVVDMIFAEKISSKGLSMNRPAFGLFELVCFRRLERLINEEDKILPIVLSWSEWPSRWSAEACLEVRRRDSLYCFEQETLTNLNKNSHLSSSSTLSSTMLMSVIRYASTSDVRPSKKVLAELSRTMLTLFCKDTNSVVARWNITTDILWYVGLEASGLAHNRHMTLTTEESIEANNNESNEPVTPALTIVECTDHTILNTGREPHNFGHTLLFNTNTERGQWIRAMLERTCSRRKEKE